MNKKAYMKPAMQIVKIQQRNHLLTVSGPAAHDEYSYKASYSRRDSGWDDEDWE